MFCNFFSCIADSCLSAKNQNGHPTQSETHKGAHEQTEPVPTRTKGQNDRTLNTSKPTHEEQNSNLEYPLLLDFQQPNAEDTNTVKTDKDYENSEGQGSEGRNAPRVLQAESLFTSGNDSLAGGIWSDRDLGHESDSSGDEGAEGVQFFF